MRECCYGVYVDEKERCGKVKKVCTKKVGC